MRFLHNYEDISAFWQAGHQGSLLRFCAFGKHPNSFNNFANWLRILPVLEGRFLCAVLVSRIGRVGFFIFFILSVFGETADGALENHNRCLCNHLSGSMVFSCSHVCAPQFGGASPDCLRQSLRSQCALAATRTVSDGECLRYPEIIRNCRGTDEASAS